LTAQPSCFRRAVGSIVEESIELAGGPEPAIDVVAFEAARRRYRFAGDPEAAESAAAS
jgi:hypothetical protein